MTLFTKKPVTVEAHQWHQNGDHPLDRVGKQELDVGALADTHPHLFDGREITSMPDDTPTYERLEGAVVRFFRHPNPEYAGHLEHDRCGRTWHDHGWIDTLEGGHTVCPGDWIITGVQGEVYPCKPDIFEATYAPAGPATTHVAELVAERDKVRSGIYGPQHDADHGYLHLADLVGNRTFSMRASVERRADARVDDGGAEQLADARRSWVEVGQFALAALELIDSADNGDLDDVVA